MIFEKICDLIAQQFAIDPSRITMETSFGQDIEADSLDIVELTIAIEEEFGLEEISDEQIESINTVGDIVRLVEEMLKDE